MTKRWLMAGALALGLSDGALAQTYRDTSGTILQGVVPMICPVGGGVCTGPQQGGGGGGGGGSVPTGTAGSPNAAVVTLQGISGGTPAAVSLSTLPAGTNTIGAIANTSFGQSGSAGADFSANKPSLPTVGSAFGSSGPYANYVLIATAAAASGRFSIDVENTSGAQIAIVLDDGTAANGAAPNNATVFALAGGSAAGGQGGSWVSAVEKGRVQVYAPVSSAQVAMRQN